VKGCFGVNESMMTARSTETDARCVARCSIR
jgi:hypothetical protein